MGGLSIAAIMLHFRYIRVDGFGCGIEESLATLNRLSFIPFAGPMQLKAPDNQFRLIQVSAMN